MRIHLGWGSNLGDRYAAWSRARESLGCGGVRIVRESSIWRTEPVGLRDQPWFLNGAVEVESDLTPWQMIRLAKAIEVEQGRVPGPRNAPRPLDIDILLMGETVLRTAGLTVPHPRLHERRFALAPLAEIAPRAVHPVLKRTIRELLRRCPDRSEARSIGPAPQGEPPSRS
jgi:2-amino-4-hydroxy-6-hydroxymethyldihydropteridine diphosphokinase